MAFAVTGIVLLSAQNAVAVDWSTAQTVTVVTTEYAFKPKSLTFHSGVTYRLHLDNRGKEILLLDLQMATPLVDYFVIITASSRRLGRAISEEIDKEMKRRGDFKLGFEGSEEGRWTLIDYGDFIVHVFSESARSYYDLERLWKSAKRLEPAELMAKPKPRRAVTAKSRPARAATAKAVPRTPQLARKKKA